MLGRKAPLFAAAILPVAMACDGSTDPLAPEAGIEGVMVTVEHSVFEVSHDDVSGFLQTWISNVTRGLEWDWCRTEFERQTPEGAWTSHWSPNCTDESILFTSDAGIGFTVEAPRDEFPIVGRTFRVIVALADEDGPLPEEERTSNAFDVTWIAGRSGDER